MTDQRGRRTFAPVLLLGLAAAALAAVAGSKAWYALPDAGNVLDVPIASDDEYALDMPLGGALALVLLACWGVLLVTRGRVRRAVAVLGLLSSLGLVATVIQAWRTLPDDLQDKVGDSATTADLGAGFTGWFWAAAVGVVVSVVACALAVRWVPAWPEMGTRYDAPAKGTGGPVDVDNAKEGDLWKAIDEGHDPTA